MINIILADDHTIVREGIKMILKSNPNISISGEAMSGLQVIKQLKHGLKADVLVTDMEMPDMDGLSLMQELKKSYPHIKIIVLSMKDGKDDIIKAFDYGARAYLLKTAGSEEIMYAIKHVQQGKKYICSQLSQAYFEESTDNSSGGLVDHSIPDFSPREKEVLRLIADGLTNTEMSERLFLSRRTIEGQRQALIEKAGCKNTASLIKYAVLNRVI